MKKIKIWFTDFWEEFQKNNNPFYKILTKKYKVIVTSKNPDYLFFSVFGKDHLNFNKCIKIFFTGESVTPNFNYCDYGIGFDYLEFEDRYLRFPIYRYKEYEERIVTRNIYKKTKFCSFVISNDWCASNERIKFFKLLSKYKKVDSGGRALNNLKTGPINNGWRAKDEFLKDYKFDIAFENTSYNGYTSERIADAFRSGCIPIYYGNPLIVREFNSKAFINCNEYKSYKDVIKRIKEIDNNDNLREKILKEPYLNYKNDNELEKFILYIFSQDKKKAMRRSPPIRMGLVDRNF